MEQVGSGSEPFLCGGPFSFGLFRAHAGKAKAQRDLTLHKARGMFRGLAEVLKRSQRATEPA